MWVSHQVYFSGKTFPHIFTLMWMKNTQNSFMGFIALLKTQAIWQLALTQHLKVTCNTNKNTTQHILTCERLSHFLGYYNQRLQNVGTSWKTYWEWWQQLNHWLFQDGRHNNMSGVIKCCIYSMHMANTNHIQVCYILVFRYLA